MSSEILFLNTFLLYNELEFILFSVVFIADLESWHSSWLYKLFHKEIEFLHSKLMFNCFDERFSIQSLFSEDQLGNLFLAIHKTSHHVKYESTFQLVKIICLLKTAYQRIGGHIFIAQYKHFFTVFNLLSINFEELENQLFIFYFTVDRKLIS